MSPARPESPAAGSTPRTEGATIKVEVRERGNSGDLSSRWTQDDLLARIEEVTRTVTVVSERVTKDLDMPEKGADSWGLDQVSIKLGVELSAEAGVVVARASTKATFEVTMTWAR